MFKLIKFSSNIMIMHQSSKMIRHTTKSKYYTMRNLFRKLLAQFHLVSYKALCECEMNLPACHGVIDD